MASDRDFARSAFYNEVIRPVGDFYGLAANTVYSVFVLDTADAPATGPVFEAGSSEEAGTILPAGKWRVTASDSDGRNGLADIELGVGEHRSLDLSLE